MFNDENGKQKIQKLYIWRYMGTANNKTEPNNEAPLVINHPKLLHAKHHKTDNGGYLEVATSISNKQLFEKWQQNVQKYEKYQQIDSLYLPRKMEFKGEGLCGSAGIVKAQYDVLPFILSEEVANRREINQPFMEKQLWYLIYSLCFTAHKLHSDNLLIGDVRPQNTFISEDGDTKLSTMYTFYDEDTNFHKTQVMKQITLLSPEQMKDLQSGKEKPTGHQGTSESFSVGLTILSAVMLRDYSYLYGTDFSFKDYEYEKQLKAIRGSQSYSSLLRKVVQGLCRRNPTERLNCSEVVELLNAEEERILNLEEFSLGSIPNGIRNKLELGQQNYRQVVQPGFNTRSSMSQVSQNQLPPPSPVYQLNDSQRRSNPHIMTSNFGSGQENGRFVEAQQPLRPSLEKGRPPQNVSYVVYPNSQQYHLPPPQMHNYTAQNPYIESSQVVKFSEGNFVPGLEKANYQGNSQMEQGLKQELYTSEQGQNMKILNGNYQIVSQNGRIGSMGRETTSIRPPTDPNFVPQMKDDQLFKSYQDVMKSVDRQLNESRRMFPDPQ